jgi:hypothetical protein
VSKAGWQGWHPELALAYQLRNRLTNVPLLLHNSAAAARLGLALKMIGSHLHHRVDPLRKCWEVVNEKADPGFARIA